MLKKNKFEHIQYIIPDCRLFDLLCRMVGVFSAAKAKGKNVSRIENDV